MKLLTANILRSRGACTPEISRFRAIFPDGTTVTHKSCRQAIAEGLDIEWMANHVLDMQSELRGGNQELLEIRSWYGSEMEKITDNYRCHSTVWRDRRWRIRQTYYRRLIPWVVRQWRHALNSGQP